jgi:hypothetical protein
MELVGWQVFVEQRIIVVCEKERDDEVEKRDMSRVRGRERERWSESRRVELRCEVERTNEWIIGRSYKVDRWVALFGVVCLRQVDREMWRNYRKSEKRSNESGCRGLFILLLS